MSNKRQRVWVPEVQLKPAEQTYKEIEGHTIHVPVPLGRFAGFVEMELIEAASGRVKERYEFPNIILTAGMDGMFASGSANAQFSEMVTRLFIGTGSTAVSPSDLKLDEPVGSTTDNGGFGATAGYVTGSGGGPWNLGNPYHFVRLTRVFTEGEVNFPTLSELGWRNTSNTPEFQFTRALIKDSGGSPITIAKTSDDQLKIIYELRLYPPTYQTSGSFVLADSATSHSWTASATDIDELGSGNGWGWTAAGGQKGQFFGFGDWNAQTIGRDTQPFASASAPGNPTGTTTEWGWAGIEDNPGDPSFSRSLFTYECGSFAQTKEATWGASLANFGSGGIQGIAVDYTLSTPIFAFYITPSIKKTDLQRLKFIWTVSATASVTSST